MKYIDRLAEIRAQTRAENEKQRTQMETAEKERWFDREIDAIKYGPHTMTFDRMIANADGAPVAPENGFDSGYDLALGDRGQKGSPSAAPEADLNPGQRPEGVAAKKAAPVAKKRKAK